MKRKPDYVAQVRHGGVVSKDDTLWSAKSHYIANKHERRVGYFSGNVLYRILVYLKPEYQGKR